MPRHLGIILEPFGPQPDTFPSGIGYEMGGHGPWLCPDDPQYNTRGEAGLYSDTPLGALGIVAAGGQLAGIPTDAELATVYGYTPVDSGWVKMQGKYQPAPWVPPNGWDAAGAFGPQASLRGIHGPQNLQATDVTIPDSATPTEAQAIVNVLNKQNDRIFKITIISTVVIGLAALINSYRMIKQLRRDEALLKRTIKATEG